MIVWDNLNFSLKYMYLRKTCNKCNCLTPGEGKGRISISLYYYTLTTELALGLGVFLDPKPSKGLMILKHSAMLIA